MSKYFNLFLYIFLHIQENCRVSKHNQGVIGDRYSVINFIPVIYLFFIGEKRVLSFSTSIGHVYYTSLQLIFPPPPLPMPEYIGSQIRVNVAILSQYLQQCRNTTTNVFTISLHSFIHSLCTFITAYILRLYIPSIHPPYSIL